MPCRTCSNRKWVMLKQDNATWTIMGCTLHKLRFGQESDLPLRKEDKLRGIVPMPVTCKEWVEYGDQKT